MTGTVRVRFFARYAELAGCVTTSVELPLPATVDDVVLCLQETLPAVRGLPDHPLVAINLKHARSGSPVRDGDEVAFLPPMSGG